MFLRLFKFVLDKQDSLVDLFLSVFSSHESWGGKAISLKTTADSLQNINDSRFCIQTAFKVVNKTAQFIFYLFKVKEKDFENIFLPSGFVPILRPRRTNFCIAGTVLKISPAEYRPPSRWKDPRRGNETCGREKEVNQQNFMSVNKLV